MIQLRILGGIELTGPGAQELQSVLAQPKRLALLVYLSAYTTPAFHSRESLFGLFWPELNTDRARAALSQSLYFLRGELGEGVLISRGRDLVGVDHERIDCDTVAFSRAVAAKDAAAALALYRGDLLAGHQLVDSVEWEAWLDAERLRLRRAAAGMAWQCSCEAEARNERAAAMYWAGRAVEWSDQNEQVFRDYLELLERQGDRAGALQAFREFAERLREEFGIDEAPETRRLIERIGARAERERDATDSGREQVAGPAEAVLTAGAEPSAELSPAPRSGRSRWYATVALIGIAVALIIWLASGMRSDEPGVADAGGKAAVTEAQAIRPEAHDLYLRGRHLLSRGNVESFVKARTHFERALELEPEFAAAWSGLADAYMRLAATHSLPREAAYPRARESAERALELDPGLAEAHASLAAVLTSYYWESAAAERHFLRALELAPDDADTLSRYSSHLRNHGRFAEARVAVERAIEIDPLAFSGHFDTVVLDLMDGRYQRAERELRNLIAVNPEDRMAHFMLARVLVQTGDFPAALAILDALADSARSVPFLTLRGYVLGRMGREAEARDVLGMLQEQSGDTAFDAAVVQLGLGDRAAAINALEQALEQRDHRVRLLREEPIFEPLRDDPRFAVLLERAGLGQ